MTHTGACALKSTASSVCMSLALRSVTRRRAWEPTVTPPKSKSPSTRTSGMTTTAAQGTVKPLPPLTVKLRAAKLGSSSISSPGASVRVTSPVPPLSSLPHVGLTVQQGGREVPCRYHTPPVLPLFTSVMEMMRLRPTPNLPKSASWEPPWGAMRGAHTSPRACTAMAEGEKGECPPSTAQRNRACVPQR